ncbi:helix-turn-helix transcriptional regulator [Nakamurella flavida]|uniref:Helix-turn-helix transcriptional regulator n=1 Tax=Nakamurella flavida TaxID=363630 RepID=A0A939C6D2_9ACTN|nr:AraC family transcriptional regulator [Nakamurella flavida]MBM9477929.1 helix-turn-helix transcriptional regulator [Nakamurella flavida]MDP9778356.1 AraC-like DNA-binding protein [Nakamurella flavida]
MDARDRVQAWRPRVHGVAEVLHAQWRDHAYPAHTHDTWTLLLVDDGLIGYHLDRQGHAALPRAGVTVLPPHVVHDGRPTTTRGFRKRVIYLDGDVFPTSLTGSAVDGPLIPDAGLLRESSSLDRALVRGDDLEAESRLALVVERVAWHLTGRPDGTLAQPPALVARRAREILDADPGGIAGIAAVAGVVGVSTAHLVRSFTRSYGIPPHRYLVGRRLDLARRRLLAGDAPVDVAAETGFYDQAHLSRHFTRLLATTPGRYRRGAC